MQEGNPGSSALTQTDRKETPEEVAARVEALDIKLYVQAEVMKELGFLPSRFNSMADFSDATKLTEEEQILEAAWSDDTNGVKGTSYAAIFNIEYEKLRGNTTEWSLLELRPHEAIKKLAVEIRKIRAN